MAYLERLRWPEGFVCPKGHVATAAWRLERGLNVCPTCRCQVSATAGTLFEGTRKLRHWFLAAWQVTSQKYGASALGIHSVRWGWGATPGVHRVASLLKRWCLGTHQGGMSKEHLPYYLDEFTFRFNRRTSKARGLLFYRLITQAARTPHVVTDRLFRATGRGRQSRRKANRNRWESDEGSE